MLEIKQFLYVVLSSRTTFHRRRTPLFSSLQAKGGSPVLLQGDKGKVKGGNRDEEKGYLLFVAGTDHSEFSRDVGIFCRRRDSAVH